MNLLKSVVSRAIVAVPLAAMACLFPVSKGTGRIGGLRNELLDLGSPHYYAMPLDSGVRVIERAMATAMTVQSAGADTMSLKNVAVRRMSDSVWMLTGEKGCSEECWGRTPAAALVRVVVKDEGQRGLAVRIVTRARYCHHDRGTCHAEDTEIYPTALRIFAQLDSAQKTTKTSPVTNLQP